MKKLISLILALTFLLSLTSCGNGSASVVGIVKPDDENVYNITIACAEESTEESRIITYWNDHVISKSGSFHAHNLNDFPVTVYLSISGEKEIVVELLPEEEKVVSDLKTNESYQVGIYADVKENDEIKILLVDEE